MSRILRNQMPAHLLVLAALAAALSPVSSRAEDASLGIPANPPNPWSFNLTAYMWLAGLKGDFSAGPLGRSVDANFIDIVDQSRRVPLGFMGRLEAHYDRLGFYLDGNYINLEFSPKFDRHSNGLDTQLGLMDYGLMYRLLGPSAAEMSNVLKSHNNANWLEVYAGGRTIWLDNSVELAGPGGGQRNFSGSKSFTSPVIGGRFMIGITPSWFALADGNFGGFGAQHVSFTGSLMGVLGYRTTVFDIPASFEAGYKVLRYNVDSGGLIKANATLNGPFIGLTGYW